MSFFDFLNGQFSNLGDFCSYVVIGPDAERFLNGQLTNDLLSLKESSFQLQARLDRSGRLLTHFYLLKRTEDYLIIVPRELAQSLIEDLCKYIIMDDVDIQEVPNDFKLLFSLASDVSQVLDKELIRETYSGSFAGTPAFFIEGKLTSNLKEISDKDFEKICLLQGEPVLGKTALSGKLVTDTIVSLSGISLSKGCYLGQETVSKIETRRGGAYLPIAIEIERPIENDVSNKELNIDGKKVGMSIWQGSLFDRTFLLASLIRNYRVEGRALVFSIGDEERSGRVINLPVFGEFNRSRYVEEKFEDAVKAFQEDQTNSAMEMLNHNIIVDPTHENSLESLGVILGRMERFEEGVQMMDQVLETNPDSVMAHTNKSLFYMKLGRIEEAEEEKAQATVKSFSQFGKEAQTKREQEEKKIAEEAELDRRMGMFKEVLGIDPEDELANYGLADVYYHKGQYQDSIPLLEKVLIVNEKYSVAYLLLGKAYLKEGELSKAKNIFEKGIVVASSQGDLMPANEMQSKLLEIP